MSGIRIGNNNISQSRAILVLAVVIFCSNSADFSILNGVFINLEFRILVREFRFFFYIGNLDCGSNLRRQNIGEVSRRGTLVRDNNANRMYAICGFVIEFRTFVKEDLTRSRIDAIKRSYSIVIIFRIFSIKSVIKLIGQHGVVNIRGIESTILCFRRCKSRIGLCGHTIFGNCKFGILSNRSIVDRSDNNRSRICRQVRDPPQSVNNPKFKIIAVKNFIGATISSIVILIKLKDKFSGVNIYRRNLLFFCDRNSITICLNVRKRSCTW